MYLQKRIFQFGISVIFMIAITHTSLAQQEPDGEVLLSFNHPALGNVYLNAVFFENVAFLPLGEVLSLVGIPSDQTSSGKGLQGTYPNPGDTWLVDPSTNHLTVKGKTEALVADWYYLGELDLYLHPEYFSRLFGLSFSVNTYALSLGMKSDYSLPIEERKKREAIRLKAQQRLGKEESNLPNLYPRDRKMLSMGILDYKVNHLQTNHGSQTNLGLNSGFEVLGGDFQGSYLRNFGPGNFSQNFSSVRWRYVFKGGLRPEENVGISSISIGQVSAGPFSNGASLLGFSATNNPVIPRLELDVFVVDGTTVPDSEVELLIGGQLVDFTRADEVGYYRFNAPITYGTVRLTTRIYTPQGEILTSDRQIQVPFSFLPKGFFGYEIKGGLPQFGMDSISSQFASHADISYGISNAVTVKAGLDQGALFGPENLYPVFGVSARLFQQYLANFEALPGRYLRGSGSVFYANNTSINAQFTEFDPNSGFNFRGEKREANLNLFVPFQLFQKFSGLRLTGERLWFLDREGANNYQIDLNSQIGRVILRLNYRAAYRGISSNAEQQLDQTFGLLTTSLTYTLPRTPSVPVYVRGLFLRGQFRYSTLLDQPESFSFMLSQTLLKNGRFTFGMDKNLLLDYAQVQVGFLYDFRSLRTSSQFTKRSEGFVFQQGLSGSLAYDPGGNTLLTGNRDQITRSGVTVRMFIDTNENGIYDVEEEVIPAKAIRLDRSANMLLGSDGLLRFSQLQSYWKYKLDVDVNALPNPNLAPKTKSFYFIAEPNRFKVIDIPLYQTGIIDGQVLIDKNGTLMGQGGVRLELRKEGENEKLNVIRSFSDGGFYTFGLLPGKYYLSVDSKQLDYMQAESTPSILEFEIKAKAEGDYLEGLKIILRPKKTQ